MSPPLLLGLVWFGHVYSVLLTSFVFDVYTGSKDALSPFTHRLGQFRGEDLHLSHATDGGKGRENHPLMIGVGNEDKRRGATSCESSTACATPLEELP